MINYLIFGAVFFAGVVMGILICAVVMAIEERAGKWRGSK